MITLLLALACTIPAGEPHPVEGRVVAVDSAAVTIEHGPIPEVLEAGTTPFTSEPNLSKQVEPGDVVQAFLMVTDDDIRVIGFEVVGYEALDSDVRPLGPGEVFPATTLPAVLGVGEHGEVLVGAGAGKVQVVTFLFTTCPMAMYCPLLSRKLYDLQTRMPEGVEIIAITIDPANDSLEVLENYGTLRSADFAKWRFARTELDEMQDLLVLAGASREEAEGTLHHNLRLMVLDGEGKLVHKEKDNSWKIEDMVGIVQSAL